MAKTKLKLRSPRKSYTVGGKRYTEGTLYDDAALNDDVSLSDLKVGEVTVFEMVEAKKRKKKKVKIHNTKVAAGEGTDAEAAQAEPEPVIPNDAKPAADVEQEVPDETQEAPVPAKKKASKKKAVSKKKAASKGKGRRVL